MTIEFVDIMCGILICLVLISLVLLMSNCSHINRSHINCSHINCSHINHSHDNKENFSMMDTCDEMFHIPQYLTSCKTVGPDGAHVYEAGIQYTYPKYLKNKEDKIKLPEDLYWAHVENTHNLSNLGKCHTIFWNDEGMAESCSAKPKNVIDALHNVFWTNRFNNITKTPEEYQAFLNSGTNILKKSDIIRLN